MTQVLGAAPQSTMAEDSAQPSSTQPSQTTSPSIDTQPAPPRKSGPRPTIGGAQPTRIPQPHLQPTRIPAPRQSAQHAKQRLHEQYEEAARNGHKQTTRGRSPKKSAKAKGKARAEPQVEEPSVESAGPSTMDEHPKFEEEHQVEETADEHEFGETADEHQAGETADEHAAQEDLMEGIEFSAGVTDASTYATQPTTQGSEHSTELTEPSMDVAEPSMKASENSANGKQPF